MYELLATDLLDELAAFIIGRVSSFRAASTAAAAAPASASDDPALVVAPVNALFTVLEVGAGYGRLSGSLRERVSPDIKLVTSDDGSCSLPPIFPVGVGLSEMPPFRIWC